MRPIVILYAVLLASGFLLSSSRQTLAGPEETVVLLQDVFEHKTPDAEPPLAVPAPEAKPEPGPSAASAGKSYDETVVIIKKKKKEKNNAFDDALDMVFGLFGNLTDKLDVTLATWPALVATKIIRFGKKFLFSAFDGWMPRAAQSVVGTVLGVTIVGFVVAAFIGWIVSGDDMKEPKRELKKVS